MNRIGILAKIHVKAVEYNNDIFITKGAYKRV